MDEKQLMHRLNERFAGFIGTVHRLQQHNQLLEREIREIRGSEKPASRLEEECGPELRRLRRMVQDVTRDKHQAEMDVGNMEEEVCRLRRQHEQEARRRSDAQSGVAVLRKDVDDAQRAKLLLDQRAQALAEEIDLMKRDHEAQVSDMLGQIQVRQEEPAGESPFGAPGVTAALREVRAQLEAQVGTELQVGESFMSHFARLTRAAESKREALRDSQQVAQEHRRQLQARSIELDCAKGTREALERQLREVEDQHKEEIIHYQNTIKDLENELISCKFDMSGYMREYQDLLNVKMALDVEILSYRKLLCGEEARLSSMSDAHVSLPYIYHQSPVYTLPCLRRPGGPHRRVEPQYKFVEEIITETTREIEMSEFEDTGSDETEAGRDEWEGGKRERGGGEGEQEEGGGEDKDGGEDEGEQMSDSQQNGPEVKSANGGGDGDQRKTGEREYGENGDAKKEQVKDKKTENKERGHEEGNVQLRRGAVNMKEERDDPVRERKAQEDLKAEEEEREESVKDDAHEDKFISVQESDKRRETEGIWKKATDSSNASEENGQGEEINKSEAANMREDARHDKEM